MKKQGPPPCEMKIGGWKPAAVAEHEDEEAILLAAPKEPADTRIPRRRNTARMMVNKLAR